MENRPSDADWGASDRFLLQTIPWVDYTVGQAAVAVVLLGLSLFFLFYGAGNLQENL